MEQTKGFKAMKLNLFGADGKSRGSCLSGLVLAVAFCMLLISASSSRDKEDYSALMLMTDARQWMGLNGSCCYCL